MNPEGLGARPQDWHPSAIRAAYSSGDKDGVLTAVFSMHWIRGFDEPKKEVVEKGIWSLMLAEASDSFGGLQP